MFIKLIICIIVMVFTNTHCNFQGRRPHPDTGLNVKQLIEKYGYPFENHTVQTEDGYILEIHRISHGRNHNGAKTGPPILFVPGAFCSSADWVNMGPEKSLGFILADQGYDVWLANYRGTRWSRKHVTFNPDVDKKQFWSYSFQQIGEYDLPAFIDYILSRTNQEKLYYIGHSLGTTTFFVLTATKTEYNKKIRLAITLSPIAYTHHMLRPFTQIFAALKGLFEETLLNFGYYELLPYNPNLALLAEIFCQDSALTQEICALIIFMGAGYTPQQLNKTMIPVIASNTPAGASVLQGYHLTQLMKSQKFQKFDYGKEKNLDVYGQPTPPEYDLSRITAPVAMYYGSEDPSCPKEDVERAANEVSNLVVIKRIAGFSHIDVLWGIDVVRLLFNDIVELMKRY